MSQVHDSQTAVPPQNINRKIQQKELLKQIFILTLIVVVIILLIIFIVIECTSDEGKPTHHAKPKPYDITVVTDATLMQFEYKKDTLYYNLALNATISNLVYGYDYIEGGALYHDVMFASSILKPFNGNITEFNAVFEGHRSGFVLDSKTISEMNNETMSGVYHIGLNLCLRLKYADYDDENPMIHCDLNVPLKSHKEVGGFHATKCELRFSDDDICSID